MFKRFLVGCTAVLAGASFVHAAPSDDVTAAAKKLAESGYTYRSTSENAGGGGGFGGGAVTGKVGKDGVALVTRTMGDNEIQMVVGKEGKGAIKMEDGWKSAAEVAQAAGDQQGPGRFMGRMIQTYKSPAAQAEAIAAKVKDLKKTDEGFTGDLTEEGVRELMAFGGGGRRGGGNAQGGAPAGGPQIKNAKGTVTFAVKDGALAKMKYNVQGSMSRGDNDVEINRTTTVEFTDVGSTKVELPAEAKAKM